MKQNLLLVVATGELDTILKFPLLYGGVSIPRGYWKKVIVVFWGASIKVVKENKILRKKIKELEKVGVEFCTCVVCAEEYKAVKKLEKINVKAIHSGELLNKALQNDKKWAVSTI